MSILLSMNESTPILPNAPKGHKELPIPLKDTDWFKRQTPEHQTWLIGNSKRLSALVDNLGPNDSLTFTKVQ